jgi:cell wall-associated NlpC family hydrolase
VAAAILVPAVGVVVLLAAGEQPAASSAPRPCMTSGPVAGLDATQSRNARIVVAATQQSVITSGGDVAAQADAELIGLVTAATETGLHDWSNPLVPTSALVPNDGPAPGGGDHDSVGLFQQRGSWGPVTARMNPVTATGLFVARLLAVPGWQLLPPPVAAQTVQDSAYPDRYAAWQTPATRWLAVIGEGMRDCGSDRLPHTGLGAPPPGTLPAGFQIPDTATGAERVAVTFALAQLGKPYVYGAAGPDAFDCSGLTMAAWAAAGITLPHYTVTQYEMGVPVPDLALAAPGDLIFIPGSDGTLVPPNPQHVGMYLGDGWVIEAPDAGEVVTIVPAAGFGPVIGIRHLG